MALLLMRFRVFLEKLYDLGKNLQFAAVCLHETEQIILKKTQKNFSCKQTVDNNNYLLSNFDEKS